MRWDRHTSGTGQSGERKGRGGKGRKIGQGAGAESERCDSDSDSIPWLRHPNSTTFTIPVHPSLPLTLPYISYIHRPTVFDGRSDRRPPSPTLNDSGRPKQAEEGNESTTRAQRQIRFHLPQTPSFRHAQDFDTILTIRSFNKERKKNLRIGLACTNLKGDHACTLLLHPLGNTPSS